MSTPTAPGWYEDPEDPAQLRYFDGIIWSSHTTPRTPPTPAPGPAHGQPPAAPGASGGWPSAEQGWGQPGGQNPWAAPPVPGAGTTGTTWQFRSDLLPDGAVLAEWWRRLLARIIDSLIAGLLTTILAWPFLQDVVAAFDTYFQDVLRQAEQGVTTAPDTTAFDDALTGALLPISLIALVVSLVYEVVFLVWRAATPGKMVLGTIVRPVEHRGGVSLVVALRRQVLTVVANLLSLVPVVGLLGTLLSVVDPAWLLWDPKRQALHDKVADTVVVMKRS